MIVLFKLKPLQNKNDSTNLVKKELSSIRLELLPETFSPSNTTRTSVKSDVSKSSYCRKNYDFACLDQSIQDVDVEAHWRKIVKLCNWLQEKNIGIWRCWRYAFCFCRMEMLTLKEVSL